MAVYFFDTSALVKRYVLETGTAWIQEAVDPLIRSLEGGQMSLVGELNRSAEEFVGEFNSSGLPRLFALRLLSCLATFT